MTKMTNEVLFKVRLRYAEIADSMRQVGHKLFTAGTQLGFATVDAGKEKTAQAHIDLAGVYVAKLQEIRTATLALLKGIHASEAVLEEVENRFDLISTQASLDEGELLLATIQDDIEAGEAAVEGSVEVHSDTDLDDEELIRLIFGEDAQIERVAE